MERKIYKELYEISIFEISTMKCVEIRDWLKQRKENILPAISRMLPSWLCVCVCVENYSRQAEEREKYCRVAILLRLSV